jgi:peptidoglycan/xylan/chitin deacetylase (PgdA/CDA1 family)
VISRGEYDMVVIPRLVALMKKYDIKGTFFTPGHTIDTSPEAVTPQAGRPRPAERRATRWRLAASQ